MTWIDLPQDRPFDAVCFGYNSVDILCHLDRYPEPGQKQIARRFVMQGGGQSATAAVALSRYGFNARYIGKFGSDRLGRFAMDVTRDEGVDIEAAIVASGVPNQIANIWVELEGGERTISYTRTPELEFFKEELDEDAVCSGKILLVDAHQLPATIEAAKMARARNIPVVVDAERALSGVEALLEQCDFILCDSTFPKDVTGEADPEKALTALSKYGRFVSTTLGAGGSLALFEGDFIRTGGYRIDRVVDTTGAGDNFHAGFAAGLLLGLDVEDTLRFANAAAALSCRELGGRAGIPTRDEVFELAEIGG